MRILIKGGVWKNTEDEILKAAVMKYGKNQWARVASLMNRKSAKQCKARWYEWLDPSIKKTEWNKEEEEKLLHLAKLMPNQWRTIAPIVGRTAGQCIEHYERLLDQAQEGAVEESLDDPRRLRPGEIDPTPETKPARPDPIDMDEDEKEMLSEARARLANTRGKKAKRKARERQMRDAKNLSQLQKRRELKAAGIETKLDGEGQARKKKRSFIDYGKEIPFQKVPPSGFYDVGDENRDGKKQKLDPKKHGLEISKMEGRHQREEEQRMKLKDQKIMKNLYKDNAPLAIMKVAAENDPVSLRKRSMLSLPAPQVSDNELEDIIKIGQSSIMGPPEGGGVTSTQALIGDYSNVYKPTPTPLRTPMQEDIIMQEAKNLRALREMTPFSEEQQQQQLPELYEGTGFQGITPRIATLATPNTVLNSISNTPSRPGVPGTPMSLLTNSHNNNNNNNSGRTPLRDQFGLNDNNNNYDDFSMSDMNSVTNTARANKEREKEHKSFLLNKLKSLPEPEFSYEIGLPQQQAEDVDEDEDDNDVSEINSTMLNKREDAADVLKRRQIQDQIHARLELERRSEVLKRDLPRPSGGLIQSVQVIKNKIKDPSTHSDLKDEQLVSASTTIYEEMVQLLLSDEYKYPHENGKKGKVFRSVPIDLDIFGDDELKQARQLVQEELENNLKTNDELITNFDSIWEEVHKNVVFIPNEQDESLGGHFGIPKNKNEILTCLKTQYAALKVKFDKDNKKSTKLESKLQITTQGYENRAKQLVQNLKNAYELYVKTTTDLMCYNMMKKQEINALNHRLTKLTKEMKDVQQDEEVIQEKYAELVSFARLSGINL